MLFPRLKQKPQHSLTKTLLADAAYRIEERTMFTVLERIEKLEQQGKNIIHFKIGIADLNTHTANEAARPSIQMGILMPLE
jgi:hypothetical protein